MYLPKLLYEEFKKLRNEKKIISKRLNKINREQFLHVKRDLFSVSNFEKLDSTKKILFSDETEFENQRFIFEEIEDFYKLRKFFILSFYFFTAKRLFFGKASITNAFDSGLIKILILNSPKKFLLKSLLFSVFSFAVFHYERKYFEADIASKITIDSRLGIFLWFESNYRIGFLETNTINFLDKHMNKQLNWVNKDIKSGLNETLMHNYIFYVLVKQHFFDVYVSKFLVDLIIPLINFQEKDNNNSISSQMQQEKFLFNLLKQYLEKRQKESFFSFNSDSNEEKNLKTNKLLSNLKALITGSFNDELSVKELDNKNNQTNEKLYLNENSLAHLIRIQELQQIYMNDHFGEKLRDFYQEYKKGNI